MESTVDRVLAIDRALSEVRSAHRLLTERIDVDAWRGPARSAFDSASSELPVLVGTAESALERARDAAMLLLSAEG
jgi:hypothetical protein